MLAKLRLQDRKVLAPPEVIKPAPPPLRRMGDPPHARGTSTAKLQMEAEMRSRIAVLGVTGGLLGDPLPGRSALDQRGSGNP
jgi:hypothetical protein